MFAKEVLVGALAAAFEPVADIDFVNDRSFFKGLGAGSSTAFLTSSGGTNATYFDSAGTLQSGAAPRRNFNPSTLACRGLLTEEGRTNSYRNNTMVGAAAGSPGTEPTNWAMTTTGGVFTRTISLPGSESGINCIDVRVQASGAGTFSIQFDQGNFIAGANTQAWTNTAYCRMTAGAMTNVSDVRVNVAENDGAGAFLAGSTTSFTPTGAALATQRRAHTRTLNNASTAFVVGGLQIVTSGAADITLRIGLPQLERCLNANTNATSPIKTSGAAVTRADDLVLQNGANFLSWFNPSEGTLVVEFDHEGITGGTFPRVVAFVGTDVNNDELGIYISGASSSAPNWAHTVGGSGTTSFIGPASLAADTATKVVVGYNAFAVSTAADGVLGNSEAVATGAMSNYVEMRLGGPVRFQPTSCQHLRRVRYYRRKGTQSRVQELSLP